MHNLKDGGIAHGWQCQANGIIRPFIDEPSAFEKEENERLKKTLDLYQTILSETVKWSSELRKIIKKLRQERGECK